MVYVMRQCVQHGVTLLLLAGRGEDARDRDDIASSRARPELSHLNKGEQRCDSLATSLSTDPVNDAIGKDKPPCCWSVSLSSVSSRS